MSIQDNRNDWIFVEVWSDLGLNPPYLLQLIHRKGGQYEILDPQNNNKKLYESQSYEDSAFWLAEDEYELISMRVSNQYLTDD